MRDFIRRDYCTRADPEECKQEDPESAQRQVYRLARKISGSVVDVGCGTGEKTSSMFQRVVGFDNPKNIKHCKKNFPRHRWVDVDLNNWNPEPISWIGESVVICADVLEHLKNIESVMNFLVYAARKSRGVVISTPERELTRGLDHIGPPTNKSHVREWTLMEFSTMLVSVGIHAKYGLVPSRLGDSRPFTVVAVVEN